MLRGALIRVLLSVAVAVSGLAGTTGVAPAVAGTAVASPTAPQAPLTASLQTRATTTVPATTPTAGSFTDVPSGAQFFTEIQWLADDEISTGWTQPDGTRTYQPLLPVARDAMAAFMYRLDGSPAFNPPAVSPFTDITPSTQFYKEITWLATQQISTGWTEADGTRTYRPLQSVGRDAMAAFMYRLDGAPAFTAPATSPFTDITPATKFYKEITWLAGQQISTGYPGPNNTRTFQPLQSVNRDAMAAFMYRFYRLTHPLTVADATFHDGMAGTRYLEQLTATGGIDPLTWNATGLPAGLTISPDGAVSGIPTGTGTTTASFTVTDAAGSTATVSRTINIPTSLPAGCIGQACAVLTPASATIQVPAASIAAVTRDPSAGTVNTVTLTSAAVNGATIAAGQILVLAPAPGIESGAIGAVSGVTTNADGTVTAALTPRTPADAYTDGMVNAIDPTMPTSGADASPVSYQGKTGNRMASTALYKGSPSSVQIPASAVKATCSGSAQITLTGLALTSTLTPSMAAKWSVLGLDRFQFDLDGAITINTGASLSGQGSCTVTFPQGHAMVPAGDLGVIVFNIQPVLKFSASGKVDVSGSVKLGCGSEYIWQGGTSHTTQHCGDTVTPIGFTSATGAKANATGTINVSMALDDMVGVTGTITGALDANYTPLSHPILTLDGTVGYELGGCLACFWPKGPQVTIATGTFYHHRLWKLDTPPSAATTAPTGPLTITTTSLPGGTAGNAYRTYLIATGGTGPYSWAITGGTLPVGLHLEPTTGAITGTPTTPGSATVTITTTDNTGTQLTMSTTLSVSSVGFGDITTVTAEQTNTYVIRSNGTVWAWGSGNQGQLGNGTTADSNLPVPVQGLTGITEVQANWWHSAYALKNDGTVWAWGFNGWGQLGDGTTKNAYAPIQVPGLTGVKSLIADKTASAYALKSDGSVWAWGINVSGELGNGTTTNSAIPVQVQGLTDIVSLHAGYHNDNENFIYAIRKDGTVWAWGSNAYGQLGDGTTTDSPVPLQVKGLEAVVSLSVTLGQGAATAFALKADGTVWSWGSNMSGMLGNGSTTNSSVPVQVSGLANITKVEANYSSAYAIRNDGTMWAWGDNAYGELGNGTYTDSNVPVQVLGISGAIDVAAQSWLSARAIDSGGKVWSWGSNNSAKFGNGSFNPIASEVPVQTGGLSNIKKVIDNGYDGIFALDGNGYLWAWGNNAWGQLGVGNTTTTTSPVKIAG